MPEKQQSLVAEPPTPSKAVDQVQEALEAAGPAEDQPSPEPLEEGEAGEAEQEQPAEDQQPVLPDDWEQHESVLERLKTAETEGYNKAKSHLTRAHNASLAELEELSKDELRQATSSAPANSAVQTFAEAIGNLDTDEPETVATVRKLLHANEQWAKVFIGTQEREAQRTLVWDVTSSDLWTKGLPEEVIDEFNATVKEQSLKLRTSVARAENREEVTKAYSKALTSYLEERDKLRDKQITTATIATESKRLEEAARKAAGLTERAEVRNNSKPPIKPIGAGGAGGVRYNSLDEARRLHADAKISNDEMRKAKVRFREE